MKMFNIGKLSWKIAIIVVAAVLIVGGILAFYFESRIVSLINQRSSLDLQYRAENAATACDFVFLSATYGVSDLRNLAESNFSVENYKKEADEYFENSFRPIMNDYMYNVVKNSDHIFAAYFAVHPDLAGIPLVNEIFFERNAGGIEHGDSQTYEECMQTNSEDMIWFYGAYNSSRPYWTEVYDFDGVTMVSYVEPVIINGTKVGVVGVDITIDSIIEVVKGIKVYDTGFAMLEDSYNGFIESNEFVRSLDTAEKAKLTKLSSANVEEVTKTELSGSKFMAAQKNLVNGYSVFILAPVKEYDAEKTASFIKFAIIFPLVLVIVIIISTYIGKSFSKPLVSLSAFMQKASSTGNLAISKEDEAVIRKYTQYNDEIGQTIASCAGFISRITEISKNLETIATGDLSSEIVPLSIQDVMGNSLQVMNTKLNEMFEEIRQSTVQVSTGSKQVADGAQLLAQGSTEQAASIEELSSSITQIAEKTKSNTDMAEKAASLAGSIKESAEIGSAQMKEMVSAVNDINAASGSIGKVIKVIDDIAFQTNILALNAAVEAARAGQHGKGFAVVAEEVRNLAAKSAEAAKDTSGLIENSIEKANLGVRIADRTADSLAEIVNGINESNQLVGEIAKSSEEQSHGIAQINSGIDQVAQVVQQNSATAEQSAAASEEMSAQSALLQELISQFTLKEGNSTYGSLPQIGSPRQKRLNP